MSAAELAEQFLAGAAIHAAVNRRLTREQFAAVVRYLEFVDGVVVTDETPGGPKMKTRLLN